MTPDGEETSSKRSRGRWAGVQRGRRSGVSSLAAGPHLAVFSEAVPASVGSSLGYLNLRASSSKISTSFSSSAGEDDVLARGKCVGAGFRSVNVREKNKVVSGRAGPRVSLFTASCWGQAHTVRGWPPLRAGSARTVRCCRREAEAGGRAAGLQGAGCRGQDPQAWVPAGGGRGPGSVAYLVWQVIEEKARRPSWPPQGPQSSITAHASVATSEAGREPPPSFLSLPPLLGSAEQIAAPSNRKAEIDSQALGSSKGASNLRGAPPVQPCPRH